jgi:hypothetical protein
VNEKAVFNATEETQGKPSKKNLIPGRIMEEKPTALFPN